MSVMRMSLPQLQPLPREEAAAFGSHCASQHEARLKALAKLPDAEALQDLAAAIREHTLSQLDLYLEMFARNVRKAGGEVHFAHDAEEARRIVVDIARQAGCRRAFAADSRICAEVGVAAALKTAGCFRSDDSSQAGLGITGADFLVAETGQACIVDEDGLAGRSAACPVHVVVASMEKVTPRLADLAVLLKLLARAGSGRAMGKQTHFVGPTQERKFHVILVDNHRSRVLETPYCEVLRCIGCGACSNACPVYRVVGPDAYGATYGGPIGAVLMPLIEGLERHRHLPQLTTLCGACFDACPVRIDLPRHLRNLRRELVEQRITPIKERFMYRFRGKLLQSRFGFKLARFFLQRRLGSGKEKKR